MTETGGKLRHEAFNSAQEAKWDKKPRCVPRADVPLVSSPTRDEGSCCCCRWYAQRKPSLTF